jgi:ribosomal protein L37AE/L43A
VTEWTKFNGEVPELGEGQLLIVEWSDGVVRVATEGFREYLGTKLVAHTIIDRRVEEFECPVCGDAMEAGHNTDTYWWECSGCLASTGPRDTAAEALADVRKLCGGQR